MARVRCWFGVGALLLAAAHVPAEVPLLRKKELERQAELIVVGKVTGVKAAKVAGASKTEYRLTVEVSKVEKGKLPGAGKALVARGWTSTLKPGEVWPGGHFSGNSAHSIAA